MQQILPLFNEREDVVETLKERPPLTIAGLFAGIGGIELGLHSAGHATQLVCEVEPCATAVLKARLPNSGHYPDVTTLSALPDVDLLAAGFPCQDLSIAGRRAGIAGTRSSLVGHVFRLLDDSEKPPAWLLLENVPFMLRLQNGSGMRYLVGELEARGYNWAYRVFDTRAFGLPHRRQRVLLLASRTEDPRNVLLVQDAGEAPERTGPSRAFGFYWTEGNRGIGFSDECIPPIKVGSGLGIPSAPAVWDATTSSFFTIDIRDAERLQGFPADWTQPAERIGKRSERWRLVGNSVSVPLGAWVGERLRHPTLYKHKHDLPIPKEAAWPQAAWGGRGGRFASNASMWPVAEETPSLLDFLEFPGRRLSPRAAAGLLKRIRNGSTSAPVDFMTALETLAEKEKARLAALRVRKLEQEVEALRRAIRNEAQFAKQVDLSTKLKSIEADLVLARMHVGIRGEHQA